MKVKIKSHIWISIYVLTTTLGFGTDSELDEQTAAALKMRNMPQELQTLEKTANTAGTLLKSSGDVLIVAGTGMSAIPDKKTQTSGVIVAATGTALKSSGEALETTQCNIS